MFMASVIGFTACVALTLRNRRSGQCRFAMLAITTELIGDGNRKVHNDAEFEGMVMDCMRVAKRHYFFGCPNFIVDISSA